MSDDLDALHAEIAKFRKAQRASQHPCMYDARSNQSDASVAVEIDLCRLARTTRVAEIAEAALDALKADMEMNDIRMAKPFDHAAYHAKFLDWARACRLIEQLAKEIGGGDDRD